VLQIYADLHSPSLHHVHELPNTLGLTNHFAGNTKPGDVAQPTQVVGLFVVTSGPLPPNPMELLASAKMFDSMSLAAERFDFVIIDGPPVIGLADAIVLSKLARSTIFVTTIRHTRHGTLEGAVKRLHTANANIIGAVVNRFDHAGGRYGYGYGYDYHYTYDYGARRPGGKASETGVTPATTPYGPETIGTCIGVPPGAVELQPADQSGAAPPGGLRPIAGCGEQGVGTGGNRGHGRGPRHAAGTTESDPQL